MFLRIRLGPGWGEENLAGNELSFRPGQLLTLF